MALIGKIRQNNLLVLLVIGGGILLFVLSDIYNSGNRGPIGPAEAVMGRVGELEIERNDFERTLGSVYNGGDAYQNRDNLWQFYVNESLVRDESAKIGLAVPEGEVEELTFGQNPSPVVRRNFSDPQTGQINRQFLDNVRGYLDRGNAGIQEGIEERQLSPNFVPIWRYQSREINSPRLQEKLAAMVTKGFYAPSWMAQDFANQQGGNRQVAYVRVPFDELDNSDVEVGDADIQSYIEANRSIYENDEETRVLSYVAFEVTPTQEDSAAIRTQLAELATDWRGRTDDSLTAIANGGTYNGAFVGANALSPIIVDAATRTAEVGSVFGPYVEGNAYKLFKLVDRAEFADSASTRHILRNATTPEQFVEANRVIDSLQNILERNRRRFGELAEEFSQDPGSNSEGGLYEGVTPGQFVRPFDRVLFQTGEVGELYKVRTQYGVHLVEVLGRARTTSPRVKVAYAVENILPSSESEDAALIRAQEFLNGKNSLSELKAAAGDLGMTVTTTAPLPLSTYSLPNLGSGQEVRDMMCWAFAADEGDVSDRVYTFSDPQLFYENNYVLVGLEDVIPEGLAPVDAVRDNVSPIVTNRKKGEALGSQLAGQNLAAIASRYDVEVDTLTNVNFTLTSLPGGVGREPKVVAAATSTPTNQMSAPIIGNNGVYVVMPITDANTGNSGNLPAARAQINSRARIAAQSNVLAGLRDAYDIEDQRAAVECN